MKVNNQLVIQKIICAIRLKFINKLNILFWKISKHWLVYYCLLFFRCHLSECHPDVLLTRMGGIFKGLFKLYTTRNTIIL